MIGLVQYRTTFSSGPAGRRWSAATCSSRQRGATPVHQPALPAGQRDARRTARRSSPGSPRRDPAAVPRTDHRGDQGQAGAHRVLQPAADRLRRRPVPAGRLHHDGLGHGPDGHDGIRWTTAPSWTRCATRCAPSTRSRRSSCFKDNRATLHLHGGTTPWISDGTAHQWITPAGENTPWPQGVSVENVPDMGSCRLRRPRRRLPDLLLHQPAERPAAVLPRPRLGHHPPERLRGRGRRLPDHRRRPSRSCVGHGGLIPTLGDRQIPLVIQDRTFVPGRRAQLADWQDPTWDADPLGRQGQPLVPPRLHAGAEPRRPERHERLRPLDVRPLVLAARRRHRTGRSPTRTTTRTATWTIRPPGSTRPTRSASRS